MRSLFLISFLLASTFCMAQENSNIQGNTITIKEIAPVWPGCEGNETQKETCFREKLALHISENFNFPESYNPADKSRKVLVNFVINKEGNPEIKSVTGGTKALREEAKRVILLLPNMKPGSLGGKPTAIEYTVPFNF